MERLTGKIKWFNNTKGFGFISYYNTIEFEYVDFFVHISEIRASMPPKVGDLVSFEPTRNEKGPKAINVKLERPAQRAPRTHKEDVRIVEKHYREPRQDDRPTCVECGRRITPRIRWERGQPAERICPYCMASQEKTSQCFIATAAYGDENHPDVMRLREFRDNKLQRIWLGRKLIQVYYYTSPPLARSMGRNIVARKASKAILQFLIKTLLR
jgi:cold shock CspA family protein